MGGLFSTSPKEKRTNSEDRCHTLFEQNQLGRSRDSFEYGENGDIVISLAAAEAVDNELRKLVDALQSDFMFTSGEVKTLLEKLRTLFAGRLKTTSKETGDISTKTVPIETHEAGADHVRSVDERKGNTQTSGVPDRTVSIETHQVGAVLQVMKNMRASAETIKLWVRATEQKNVLNQHTLRDLSRMLKLDENTDDSIALPQSEKETILQNIMDYLRCVDEGERHNHIQRDTYKNNTEEIADKKIIENSATYEQKKLKIEVQIVDPLPSKANEMFYESLKRWMERHGIELIKLHTTALTDVLSGLNYIIVICNNMSRLLANVSNTLANIHGANCRRIFLIVLHCQKEAYLPCVSSKSELLKSGDFKNLPEAVDFAFNTDDRLNGIYDCEMNKRAFGTLEQFIKNAYLVAGVIM